MTSTSVHRLIGRDTLRRAAESVRPYTMVSDASRLELAYQVAAVLADGIPGDFVECGVWRGGSAFLMAMLLREAGVRDRTVWLCDSFEGLPAPDPVDGASALRYVEDRTSPRYRDNCRAALDDVRRSAEALGLTSYVRFVPGWFDATLPALRAQLSAVALLRIDADWHASVRCCLDNLYDTVVDGGLVVLDDYFAYDGCAVAVHEFLGERRLAHRLESFVAAADAWDGYQAAMFRKAPTTWGLMRRRYEARLDVAAVVPSGARVLILDEQQLGLDGTPFPERYGGYGGPSADDADAIEELERLRAQGAAFLVVAWPAFWWLTFYAAFHRHLRSTARCVVENDRVVVFDLTAEAGAGS